MEALPWAVGQQRFTRALLVTIETWTRVLPWQQVATLFGCAWGTVERAVEAASTIYDGPTYSHGVQPCSCKIL